MEKEKIVNELNGLIFNLENKRLFHPHEAQSLAYELGNIRDAVDSLNISEIAQPVTEEDNDGGIVKHRGRPRKSA
jgi:hypothetical protein